MKIVNLLGGLGNQMFEYAMYLALVNAHPQEKVKVCTRSYRGYRLHNGIELQRIFGVELPEASIFELARVAYPFFNYKTWQLMRHFLPQRKSMTRGGFDIPFDYSQVERMDSAYYEGYWQNEKNFYGIREKILEAYTFPCFFEESNINLASLLKEYNAVSCHVRRGDYLNNSSFCVCSPNYYKRAITEIKKRTNPDLFLFFSDDILWCKETFCDLENDHRVVYVDWNTGNNSFRDMQLMSLCRHNIIANSSFSWWGAWLNKYSEKIVIAPERWLINSIANDPICDNWIRIGI